MGTCHSDVLNTLSKRLWLWRVSRNIWISAAHIAGKSNQQADLESRQNKTETEWMLNRDSLSHGLTQLNFHPEVDLFFSDSASVYVQATKCNQTSVGTGG